MFARMAKTLSSVLACLLALTLLSGAVPRPPARSYVVIVNAANPIMSMTDADVAKIFLKRKLRWANGRAVVPVDQQSDAPARVSFSIEILRKKPSAVDNYWQQQIFSARELPPIEKTSDRGVVEFIAANPDAIGYVAAATVLGPGVRVIEITQP